MLSIIKESNLTISLTLVLEEGSVELETALSLDAYHTRLWRNVENKEPFNHMQLV